MKATQKCYGTMFPDLAEGVFNTPREGKAFTVLVESCVGIANRQSSVKGRLHHLREHLLHAGHHFPGSAACPEHRTRHKILSIVRKQVDAKHAKLNAEKPRALTADTMASSVSRVAFPIAGEFGEERFLAKLEDLIKDRPVRHREPQARSLDVQGRARENALAT